VEYIVNPLRLPGDELAEELFAEASGMGVLVHV
jgi:hypothetical protein